MRTRFACTLLGVAGLALAAACVPLKRTPQARFFVLRSTAEPAASGYAGADLVGLLPVRLPAHLDRPQLVLWSTPGELRIDEFLRWGEPLDAGITRALAEDLDRLLPEHPVVRYPWPSGAPLRCRVRVELQRFGAQPGREVRLSGRWTLLPATDERPLRVHATNLAHELPGPVEPEAAVTAMSGLVGDLALELASAIRTLPAPVRTQPETDPKP